MKSLPFRTGGGFRAIGQRGAMSDVRAERTELEHGIARCEPRGTRSERRFGVRFAGEDQRRTFDRREAVVGERANR